MRSGATPDPSIKRILVGTDRSHTADQAVRWAARMADGYQAQLVVLQVLVPPSTDGASPDGAAAGVSEETRELAVKALQQFAEEVAGPKATAKVVVAPDPAAAILDAIDTEGVDVVVVGNLGMAGRKQFLLGNVPNRISHNARCTVVIVNTALLDGQASSRARPSQSAKPGTAVPTEGQLLRRAMRIGRVLVTAGLREVVRRSPPADETGVRMRARRIRQALEELGPTFAKMGQIMSTRPDLLPAAFIEELATLQEHVTPLTEAEVVGVMEQELGVPWEDVFGSIDPKPLAAGTIAQVHRATLETGERVVVKVQRPTAERDILQDLGLLDMFVEKTAERPAFRRLVDLPAVIRQLSASLRRELDFRREASNIKRMREVLSPYPRLGVPKVYEEYSTARLLVMEEVQGTPVLQAPEGPARKEAARQLMESFYRQVLIEGFFHADPHPGNMKWWNDKIYLLDLGMVGEIDPEVRGLILLLLLAFSQKDASFLAEVIVMLAGDNDRAEDLDSAALQAELETLISRYRNLSLKEIQLGPMLQEVIQISIRQNIRVPAALALAGKAFSQMQLVAGELDPTLDPFSVASSFIMKNTLREFAGGLDPKKIFYELQKGRVRLLRFVESVEGLAGARPGRRLQVNFRGTERLETTIAQASRRVSLALGLTGFMVGAAVTAVATQVPGWVPGALGGIAAVLVVVLIADLARGAR